MSNENLNSWDISYSAKDKCLFISATGYHAGSLKLSRKELYRYGRQMSKKARGSSR